VRSVVNCTFYETINFVVSGKGIKQDSRLLVKKVPAIIEKGSLEGVGDADRRVILRTYGRTCSSFSTCL